MPKNERKIIFEPKKIEPHLAQKRMDELGQILYDLYCQYRLTESVRHKDIQNNLEEEIR